MVVLSYGYKQPENGDRGSVYFPALNFNITQLNAHNHDGVTSAAISNSNLSGGSVATSTWSVDTTGSYKQDLTVPTGYDMTNFTITTRITSSGLLIYPTIEKLTNTTFRIYTVDNTLAYTVYFR